MDNVAATILQGRSIPISQVSAAGVNTVFVDATMNLTVTPKVTNEGTVMLRVCQPTSTAAQDIDMIRRQYLTTMPAPRIPFVSQNAGSSSTTAGSGNPTSQSGTGGR